MWDIAGGIIFYSVGRVLIQLNKTLEISRQNTQSIKYKIRDM
nr:MAG TPA: hypothetical protein [Caudoviricetes sp.]